MLGTKVEITLPKAEPGHWAQLYFPKAATEKAADDESNQEEPIKSATAAAAPAESTPNDDDSDVDLNDIEQVRGVKITDA